MPFERFELKQLHSASPLYVALNDRALLHRATCSHIVLDKRCTKSVHILRISNCQKQRKTKEEFVIFVQGITTNKKVLVNIPQLTNTFPPDFRLLTSDF
jgi:hypothetical protein